jgi:hypothetical protein
VPIYKKLSHRNLISCVFFTSKKNKGGTTGIQLFAKCSVFCRVHFVGHSATITFTERKTLGNNLFTECQILVERRRLVKDRQQNSIVDSCYLRCVPSGDARQMATLGERQHLAKCLSLSRCDGDFFCRVPSGIPDKKYSTKKSLSMYGSPRLLC